MVKIKLTAADYFEFIGAAIKIAFWIGLIYLAFWLAVFIIGVKVIFWVMSIKEPNT